MTAETLLEAGKLKAPSSLYKYIKLSNLMITYKLET
jgi:hypothetical protein